MIIKIKDRLRGNDGELLDILESLNLHNIHKKGTKYRFGFDEYGSGTGNVIDIETLTYSSFSKNSKGDIITLVSDCLKVEIKDSIKWLANKLNIKCEYTKRETKLPFDGFFKKFKASQNISDTPPKVYPETCLKDYLSGCSLMWIKEGICPSTQELFCVGYDVWSNRIIFPWRNEMGEIVGIMGRLNKIKIEDREAKYLPLIAFNKSKVLYGFYENYKNILNSSCVIVAESEKSVLLGYEKGVNNVVALGGNDISERQAKLLKSLCTTVIIALDEDIPLERAISQAKKVKVENVFFSNDVYVVDMDNSYVKDKKVSLLDLDEEVIKIILKEHLIYVE